MLMDRAEALAVYAEALKRGQKYYKDAVKEGRSPYPTALDDLITRDRISGTAELGIVNIPSRLLAGTKSEGRTAALAGNFMPLMQPGSEFSGKWISLCQAHLSDEGIRDAIKCYEYMGRFYVEEGNKRASVLLYYGSPTIPAEVTRIIPAYSDDTDVRIYYEFMKFYSLSKLYSVTFSRPGGYRKLQAALGLEKNHVWTEWERRSFSAGFELFREAFEKANTASLTVTAGDALLVWLEVFTFANIKELTPEGMTKMLRVLWPDIAALAESGAEEEIGEEPSEEEHNIFSRLLGIGQKEHLNVGFIYAFPPETSSWTMAHERGRLHLEEKLGSSVKTAVYEAFDRDYSSAIERAVQHGEDIIFATTPPMISACRAAALRHPDVKVLNCALSKPYAGVRLYYSRIYECKFITGAIAGAMTENDRVGYVAGYPISGTTADINAFALGVRMTNPRAKVHLKWSCVEGHPKQELADAGITVISNRDATSSADRRHLALEWGTYVRKEDGQLHPLAVPSWDWGLFYTRIVESVFRGTYEPSDPTHDISYWWGLKSGVTDVVLSRELPAGVRSLAEMLKVGIITGTYDPFYTEITDNFGNVINDGSRVISAAELREINWLCENIEGRIPTFDELRPESRETVLRMGLHNEGTVIFPAEKQI